jgi:hypothetical protein
LQTVDPLRSRREMAVLESKLDDTASSVHDSGKGERSNEPAARVSGVIRLWFVYNPAVVLKRCVYFHAPSGVELS